MYTRSGGEGASLKGRYKLKSLDFVGNAMWKRVPYYLSRVQLLSVPALSPGCFVLHGPSEFPSLVSQAATPVSQQAMVNQCARRHVVCPRGRKAASQEEFLPQCHWSCKGPIQLLGLSC